MPTRRLQMVASSRRSRSVDTDKPVPARLSPPTGADQISEARRVSPTMSARDVCDLIDPWQKCSFSKPNIMVVDPKITTQAAAISLCNEFVGAVRGMRKVGEPMEPGWILQIHSSKGELASCYLPQLHRGLKRPLRDCDIHDARGEPLNAG